MSSAPSRSLAPSLYRALAVTALLFAGSGCAVEETPSYSQSPDVLLVILDTVRRDHVSPCNPGAGLTPNLQALSKEGTSFCRMVTPGSWTLPVHGSIFTGRLPREHGADFVDTDAARLSLGALSINPLKAEIPTLAEQFAAAGYQTILVSENPVLDPGTGLVRGFQVGRIGRSFEHDPDESALVALRALLEESDQSDRRPRFIVVNLCAAHEPYVTGGGEKIHLFEEPAPESLFHRFTTGKMAADEEQRFVKELREAYALGIRRVDADLGRVLEALRSHDWIDERSLIAVTSDHGEHLGEFGLLDHGRSVHRANIDVFAVVKLPSGRRIEGGVERLVQSQDLFPTLLRWSGLPVPETPHAEDLFAGTEKRVAITTSEPDQTWQKMTDGRHGADFLLGVQRDEVRIVRTNGTRDVGQEVPGILPVERPVDPPAELVRAADAVPLPPMGAPVPVTVDEERRKALQSVGYID